MIKIDGELIVSILIGIGIILFITLFVWTYSHDSYTSQEDCTPNYQGGCDY